MPADDGRAAYPLATPAPEPVRVARVEPVFLSAPLERPLTTPFLTTVDCTVSLLVRVEDTEGAVGWGEAWCNFPRFGGPHRARILSGLLAPLLLAGPVTDVAATFRRLSETARRAALQAGEPGPFAQALAGLDIALWDLVARRAGQPLWRLLGGEAEPVGVYASLGWPAGGDGGPLPDLEPYLERGFRAFKVKIAGVPPGCRPGPAAPHLRVLERVRAQAGEDAEVMADVNQSWPVERAAEMARQLAPFRLAWLEEPLPADAPQEAWRQLAAAAPMPLAAGENLQGEPGFEPYLRSRACRVLQPDMAKWGGFSGTLPLARRILAAGLRFCPHYFGGGIGLAASAHLLAAAGGTGGHPGLLEVGVDPAPEPLRDRLAPLPPPSAGRLPLPEAPGLGVVPDPDVVRRFRVPL